MTPQDSQQGPAERVGVIAANATARGGEGELPVFLSDDPLRRRIVQLGAGVLAALFLVWALALVTGVVGFGRLPEVSDGGARGVPSPAEERVESVDEADSRAGSQGTSEALTDRARVSEQETGTTATDKVEKSPVRQAKTPAQTPRTTSRTIVPTTTTTTTPAPPTTTAPTPTTTIPTSDATRRPPGKDTAPRLQRGSTGNARALGIRE